MEKPVRIIATERIKTFNHKVSHGLEHALNFMLGTDEETKIKIADFDCFLMPIESYLAAYKKNSILLKVYSDKDFKGEIYWFFELPAAILLGAILRILPEPILKEKLANQNFEKEDADSFGEVGNQLCGILDRAFRTLTAKNIHLTLDFDKPVFRDTAIEPSIFKNKEEYVVLLTTITVPKHGSQKLTLLLPRSLYEVMLNLELGLEGITPKTIVLYHPDEFYTEALRQATNNRYRKIIAAKEPDDIFNCLEDESIVGVAIHLKRLSFPLEHSDSILIKRVAANKKLAKLPLLLTWGNPSAEGVATLTAMGISGASEENFDKAFPTWLDSATK